MNSLNKSWELSNYWAMEDNSCCWTFIPFASGLYCTLSRDNIVVKSCIQWLLTQPSGLHGMIAADQWSGPLYIHILSGLGHKDRCKIGQKVLSMFLLTCRWREIFTWHYLETCVIKTNFIGELCYRRILTHLSGSTYNLILCSRI